MLQDQSYIENTKYMAKCNLSLADNATKVKDQTAVSKETYLVNPHGTPDFEWLHERCDGDTQLVLEVLRCFCEQGQTRLQAMQSALKEMDMSKLVFHAVKTVLSESVFAFSTY
jgi:hypothetical protein